MGKRYRVPQTTARNGPHRRDCPQEPSFPIGWHTIFIAKPPCATANAISPTEIIAAKDHCQTRHPRETRLPTADSPPSSAPLEKPLGLRDVYAISTGAMFASGFFLLPGVAAADAGPAVIVAYAIASLIMVPTALAIAELSTTMPRAGGPFYFIDRSFGPATGTIGGIGVWFVLVLKSAFALVGMGAYLGLVLQVPIEPVAIAMTAVFAVLNIGGAKQGANLQQVLVLALVVLVTLYLLAGFWAIGKEGFAANYQRQLTPLVPFGAVSVLSTIAMVFVSFAGLSKVASVAEEVDRPERNIPLGIGAGLLTVAVIYVAGVYVMVATLPPSELHNDLTPVATSASSFVTWLPAWIVTLLIVAAAIAAFASTGNAGLLAASRIPLAMARDGLAWAGFDHLGRYGTPTRSIIATAVAMVMIIVLFDVESLAKLASSFLLFTFVLLNLAIIVMRESRIESYVPNFSVPLYPWTPLLGIITSVILIVVLGWFYAMFLLAMIALSLVWYFAFAARHVDRRGAIYNVFARLAKRKYEPLEEELWNIMQEHAGKDEAVFEALVAESIVLDFDAPTDFDHIVDRVAERLADEVSIGKSELAEAFRQRGGEGGPPVTGEAVLIDLCQAEDSRSRLVMVRVGRGSHRDDVEEIVGEPKRSSQRPTAPIVYAALFLVSPEGDKDDHRRLLAVLNARIDQPGFTQAWQQAKSEQALRASFLSAE
jgi:basic amino acid/polyamine antiporter, APA family